MLIVHGARAQGARRRRRLPSRAVGTAMLAVVVTACGSPPPSPASPSASPASSGDAAPSANPGASGGPASPGAYPFPDRAAVFSPTEPPIDLTVTPEASNTVTALIPIAGGEMSATGADGTVYTLTIPDDALLTDTEISMTPVASVKGLPTGGDVTYAVQLGPDGLHLADFATLTITPVVALPVDQQIPFGYEAAGSGMFLALPVTKDPRIQLRILHFSGYGVTKGQLADLAPVRQRLGGDVEARLNSQIAELLARKGALERSGQDVPQEMFNQMQELLDEFQRLVVDVRIAAAGQSCASARLAVLTLQNLGRQRQLIPGGQEVEIPVSLLTTEAHVCTKEEYELCHDDHIVWRMLTVIFGYERQRQLLGFPDDAEWAFEKGLASKCLTFEVRLESKATVQQGPTRAVSEVSSKVFIAFDANSFQVTGHSSLVNTYFKLTSALSGGCTIKSVRGGSDLKVVDLSFTFAPGTKADDPGTLKDIALTFRPAATTESGSISCSGAPTQPFATLHWSDMFLAAHGGELKQSDANYLTKEWKVKQAAKMGTKEWDLSPGSGVTEQGSFELYHEPR